MTNDEYEDVSGDATLVVVLNPMWEPVSRVSQIARILNRHSIYVLYINSKIKGFHRGAVFKNGDVIKSIASLKLDELKMKLENIVINDVGI